jgi:putative hemolysin
MGRYLGEIITIAILIGLNGYFAAAEIALVSARRTALQQSAEKGSAGARAALRLLADPNRLLSTISVAITLVGFTAASLAAVTFDEPLTAALTAARIPGISSLAAGLAVFLVTIAVTYFTLVFGELTPKRLGLKRSERVATAVARPVTWLSAALTPVVWLLGRSTDVTSRLIGLRTGPEEGHAVSEEEIKILVTEQGTLLDEEKRMIREVFELGDTVAREIMVPRVDMEMLPDTLTVGEALPRFRTTGFSRIPVFHDAPDDVTGVALLKDLLGPMAAGRTADPLGPLARQALFVPETKPILDLLQEMRAARNHMAIVVDEHGGTAGVVTIEDILEEVIGDISDEFDTEDRHLSHIGENVWLADGRMPVEDANEKLGLGIPESEEYETLAGWVLSELGHIPAAGELVWSDGAEVRVQTVRSQRIARLRITLPAGHATPGTVTPEEGRGGPDDE